MSETLKFPDGFKWGSATSAHQVEGGNHNDWTEWEKNRPKEFRSGKACDSYNRYEEDFSIAKNLNHNTHRFSIEWSRIEPEEGKFDERELEHYKRLIDTLRDRGIEPMVTLWHFTNPIWFANKGGWLDKRAPEYFTRYTKYVVDNLKDRVGLWITFNEASTVYATHSFLRGMWPPRYKNFFKFFRVRNNFAKAHTLSYQEIRKIYGVSPTLKNDSPTSHNVAVGITENQTHNIIGKSWHEKLIGKIYDYIRNDQFLTWTSPYCDFVGLNYYHADRRTPGSYRTLPKQEIMTEMGWEIYAKGLYYQLKNLKRRYNKPVYITENGIADRTDQLREKFIKEHLYWVWKALQEGVDVRGYMYWSLLDNFEWAKGFEPRFGLVEIDYATLERKIRPSAHEYAKICRENQLEL